MTADAILWRTTFLDLLLGWEEFRARHQNDGELPTASMLKVAATIPTYGDDTSFDIDLFEEELENLTERSEEHTSELQSLMRISYAVFCLKKQHNRHTPTNHTSTTTNPSHHPPPPPP